MSALSSKSNALSIVRLSESTLMQKSERLGIYTSGSSIIERGSSSNAVDVANVGFGMSRKSSGGSGW